MDVSNHPTVKALDALNQAIQIFRGESASIVVSEDKLKKFLEDTKDSELDPVKRLIALGSSLQSEVFANGWNGFKQIYDFANQCYGDDPILRKTISGLFITGTIDHWILESSTLPLAERIEIAQQAELLLKQENLVSPSAWCSQSLAMLYLRHPARLNNEKTFLSKALTFLEDAKRRTKRDSARLSLMIADCRFDLEDWGAAAQLYDTFDELMVSRFGGPGAWERLQTNRRICTERLAN